MDSVRRGAAGSAVNLGSQLFRKAAAGSSYLKGHALRGGRGISSRSVPPVQGEQLQVQESIAADEGGTGTPLVPLFKPDRTQDGPACACLQALEPYAVLCCSAGAYAGNYFFISKDAHGEILGGGPHLVRPALATAVESAGQQKPQQQEEATAIDAVQREKSCQQDNYGANCLRSPLQSVEPHMVEPNTATGAPHITVSQQPPTAEQLERQQQVQRRERQSKAQAGWQANSQERQESNLLSGPEEPAGADLEAESHQQAKLRQQGLPSWTARADAEPQKGDDRTRWRRRPRQLKVSQVDTTQLFETGRSTVGRNADQQQQQEEKEEQRYTQPGSLVKEQRTMCSATARQVEGFRLDDVTMRIEHAGLSAVHARIWEDPRRKHLEDRLNIEDLSSEEGTWKKVRWDRPIPVCRCNNSPRSTISSGSYAPSIAADSLRDDDENQKWTGDDAGDEGAESTARLDGDEAASELSGAEPSERAPKRTTVTAPELAVVVSEVETVNTHVGGGRSGQTAQRRVQQSSPAATLTGALSGETAVPEENGHSEAARLQYTDTPSTQRAFSGCQQSTGSRSGFQFRPGQEGRTQCAKPASPEGGQSVQQRHHEGHYEHQEGTLANGQPPQGLSQLRQEDAEQQQRNTVQQTCEEQHVGRGARGSPFKEGQHEGGPHRVRKGDRLRRRTSSSQIVNFSGRLLRFERGPPLSPAEAFDEFLLTFELQHLKDRLIACLRQRGCCCSRARRTRREATSTIATPFMSIHQGPQPRGVRPRARAATLRAASSAAIRDGATGTTKAKAAEASNTENARLALPGFVRGVKAGFTTGRANCVAVSEASQPREGFHQWNRLTAISHIKRERVLPMHAAAAYSSEERTSRREHCRRMGVKRWASLASARSRDSAEGQGTSTDSLCSAEEASDAKQGLIEAAESTGNILCRDAVGGDEEEGGKRSEGTCDEAHCDYFRSVVPATKSQRPASTYSRNIWWRNRVGGVATRRGNIAKRKGNARLKASWPKAACPSEREQSCCRCSSCEGDPLRWLWRADPLSLLYDGESSELRGRAEAGDGQVSRTAEDATTKGVGIATNATPAAGGATGGLAKHEIGRSTDKHAQKRPPLLWGTSATQTREKDNTPQGDANTPRTPLHLVLTPDEVDRWRMACVELPRHFLPVGERSRPLTIYDVATGLKLGEVRWSGCFLVSHLQVHVREDQRKKGASCPPGATPEATAAAATTALAVAASPHPMGVSPTADADEHGQHDHAQLEKPLLCECQQQEAHPQVCQKQRGGQPQPVSMTRDHRHATTEHPDEKASSPERCAGSSPRECAVAQAADSMTYRGSAAKDPSLHSDRASATFLGSSSALQTSMCSSFRERECRQLDPRPEAKAACDGNTGTGSASRCSGRLRSAALNSTVSTLGTASFVSECPRVVVSATQTSDSAFAEHALLRERACVSDKSSRREPGHTKGTAGVETSNSRSVPSSSRASGSQGTSSNTGTEWSSEMDPLKNCDCWLVSSVTKQEDRRPRPSSFAFSPRKLNRAAGAAQATCIQGKVEMSASCAVTPARGAVEGTAAAGGAEGVAVSEEGAGTLAAIVTRPAEVGTPLGQSAETARATSALDLSGTAARQPAATAAATPRVQRTARAGLHGSTSQGHGQNTEDSGTHGEDAPVEAVAQRLRTSSVSSLLHGRLLRKTVCGNMRPESRSVNNSIFTKICMFRGTGSSLASSTKTRNTVVGEVADSVVGIQRTTSGATRLYTSQRDSSTPQSQCSREVALGAHVGSTYQQRRNSERHQHMGTGHILANFVEEPLSHSRLPRFSPATGSAAAMAVRRGGAAQGSSRRWSIGMDGLLHWSSSRRRSSGSQEKMDAQCRESFSIGVLPSSKNPLCVGRRLSLDSTYSETTQTAASRCSSIVGSGGESTPSSLDSGTPPGECVSVREYPVFPTPEASRTPAGLPFSSSDTGHPYLSYRTLRSPLLAPAAHCGLSNPSVDQEESAQVSVRRVPVRNHEAIAPCSAPEAGSNHLDLRRATRRRSLAAAAAAPVFAVVRSAAAAMAAVVPAVLTAGATSSTRGASSPAMHVARVGSSCAAVASCAADTSTGVRDLLCAAPPPLGGTLQTAKSATESAIEYGVRAVASGDGTAAVFAPAACRAAADRSSADEGGAVATFSAAADNFLRISTASLRSVVRGSVAYGAYPQHSAGTLRSVRSHNGSALPAVSGCPHSTMCSTVPTSAAASDVVHPPFMCQRPLRPQTPAFGATVAGAIRSSIRRRRNSFCRREGNSCHFPLLAPARAASCLASHPFRVERSHKPREAPSQSAFVAITTAHVQMQKSRGISLLWRDALKISSRAGAACEEVPAPPGWSAAVLHAAASASSVVESVAPMQSDLCVSARGRARRIPDLRRRTKDFLGLDHSSSTEHRPGPAAVREESLGTEARHNRGGHLAHHSEAERATPAVTGEQTGARRGSRTTGINRGGREGSVCTGEAHLRDSSGGDDRNKGTSSESSSRHANPERSFPEEASCQTKTVEVETRTGRLPSACSLSTPESDLPAVTQYQRTDVGQCSGWTRSSRSAEERGLRVQLAQCTDKTGFCAAQMPVLEGGCALAEWRGNELLMEKAKVARICETGNDISACTKQERARFSCQSGSPRSSAAPAPVGTCSGILARPRVGADSKDSPAGRKQDAVAFRSNRTQQAAVDSWLHIGRAWPTAGGLSVPIMPAPRNGQLHECTLGGEEGFTAGQLTHWQSAFSSTVSTAPSAKDLQDGSSRRFSLVREARHRTSPEVLSSDSSECSGLEDQGRIEVREDVNPSSSKSDVSAMESGERTENNQRRGFLGDARGARTGEVCNNALKHASAPLSAVPRCATDNDSSGSSVALQGDCVGAVLQPVPGPELEKPVRSHEDSGRLQDQEVVDEHQRLPLPVAKLPTARSLQISAKGPLSVRKRSYHRKRESTAANPPLHVNAAGQAPGSLGDEEGLLGAQRQIDQGGAVCGSTDTEGVAKHDELELLPKTAVDDVLQKGFVSTKQRVSDASEELREDMLRQPQQHDRREAKKTVDHTVDGGLGSDSSVGGHNGDKRPTEEVMVAGECSEPHVLFASGCPGGTNSTRGTPQEKGELKCMLFSLGDGSNVKTPPKSPLQGWRAEENRTPENEGKAVSAAMAGHASPPVFVGGNLMETESADVSVQETVTACGHLATQHRIRGRPTSAHEGSVEKSTGACRSPHPALSYATRKLLSFMVRPSAPSAISRDGDEKVRAGLQESVSVSERNAVPPATASNTPDPNEQLRLPTDNAFADTTCVTGCASWRRLDAVNVRHSASLQESVQLNCERTAEESGPASLFGEVAQRRQHINSRGQLLPEPKVTKNVPEEGSVVNVVTANSSASSGQGETKGGHAVDSSVRSGADYVLEWRTDTVADHAVTNLKQGEQTCAHLPYEAKRGWVKRTEGKCTGALNTLHVAAAAQYVATRKKVASRLTRKQSSGTEEVSSGTAVEATPVERRRQIVDEEASNKKRGGRVKLFPYRKCERKKNDLGRYREEDFVVRREVTQVSESTSKCSSESYSSGSEVHYGNQSHAASGFTGIRVKGHKQSCEQRERHEEDDDNEDVFRRDAAADKLRHLNAIKSIRGQQEKEGALANELQEKFAPGRMVEFTGEEEEASTAAMGLRVVHENELRLLLQAQAYLLRQKPRRQDFPEVIIPAAADDHQHMYAPVRLAANSMERSPARARNCLDGTISGPERIVRTIKPCYSYSAAAEHWRGFIRERAACSVLSPPSPTSQHTSSEGVQNCEAASEPKGVPQSCTRRSQKSARVSEADGEFAGDVFGTARDTWSKKVLCVYAAGEFQLLLAEPDDEEAVDCASACTAATEAARAICTSDYSISTSQWRTCSCWVRLQAKQPYRLRPGDVLRVGPLLEFSLKRFLTGVASQQGYRLSMEDEEVAIQDLGVAEDVYCSFFAVYDGHGGRSCAEFVKRVLHVTFRRELLRMCGGSLSMSSTVRQHVYQALLSSFLSTDAAFLGEQQRRKRTGLLSTSGCACVVVVILGGEVWCANCGDARAVLCRGGKALELSSDHKPHRKDEMQRIVAAGGFVRSKRVLGRLAVSRAFGDVDYKGGRGHSVALPANVLAPASADAPIPFFSRTVGSRHEVPETSAGTHLNSSERTAEVSRPLVTAVPEIRMQPLCEEDEFLLLACDGLFDVFTSQEAADFVRDALNRRLADFGDPQALVDALLYEAIEKRRSRDNVTAILVLFSPAGRSVAIATARTRPEDALTKELA